MTEFENRAAIERHLAQAECAFALGPRHLDRQRGRLVELERDGHNTVQAKEPLVTFEESLALHIEDRDRLRNELTDSFNLRRRCNAAPAARSST